MFELQQLALFKNNETDILGKPVLVESGLTIFTDGASRGNPGLSGVGIVIKRDKDIVLSHGYKIKKNVTNNVAEYLALYCAVLFLKQEISCDSYSHLVICADSELLIRQMLREYRVRDPKLLKIFNKINSLLQNIGKPCSFRHVRRELNTAADKMANLGIDDNVLMPPWLETQLMDFVE